MQADCKAVFRGGTPEASKYLVLNWYRFPDDRAGPV